MSHKPWISLAFLCCSVSSVAYGSDANTKFNVVETSFTTHFVAWHGSKGSGRGFQSFTPLELSISGPAGEWSWMLGARSAFIASENQTTGARGSVRTLSDTVLQGQLTYEGNPLFQPFFTLAVNAPTGHASLRGNEKNAIMDRDLVFQTRFGEGWNINPAFGVSVPLSSELTATTAIGYNIRGRYKPDGDLGWTFQPGGQIISSLGLQYLTREWLAALDIKIVRDTAPSKLDGIKYFFPGTSFTIGGQIARQWNEQHSTSLQFNVTSTTHNKSFDLLSGLYARDQKNSNSNVYNVSIAHEYKLREHVSVFGRAEWLFRDRNLFQPESDFFVSAKTRYTVEAGLQARLTSSLNSMVSLGYVHVRQDATPYANARQLAGIIGRMSVRAQF